jgi:hypothetical protein
MHFISVGNTSKRCMFLYAFYFKSKVEISDRISLVIWEEKTPDFAIHSMYLREFVDTLGTRIK